MANPGAAAGAARSRDAAPGAGTPARGPAGRSRGADLRLCRGAPRPGAPSAVAAPGSDRDLQLGRLLAADAIEHDGVLTLPDDRARIGIVTWEPR